jgi:hypothetical protein
VLHSIAVHRAVVITAFGIGLAGVAACSSSGRHATPHTTGRAQGPASTTTIADHSTTTTTKPGAKPGVSNSDAVRALRAHMVDSIPGYSLQPAGSSGTGPFNLATAAEDAGGGAGPEGAAERAALTDAGFQVGYKLLFTAPSDREILSTVYRFETAAGAEQYAQHAFTARVHDGGAPSARTPAGVPGARVVERSESDASAALAIFPRGRTLVILSTIQPPGTDATALLEPVATEQYQRLAGY